MKKVCFVLTAEFAVTAFLLNHLQALSKLYDVKVIVNTSNPNFLTVQDVKVSIIPLAMARKINPFSDLLALIMLIKIFHKEGFDAVHSLMPKAGLLAMLAAWIVRVPLRVHSFTGQVWVTKSGYKRFLLKQFDCLIAFLTTHNIVDSPSQRQFLIDEKVMTSAKSIVFAKGSISGVDVVRFKPDSLARENIRRQFNIASDAIVFLFLGRLTKDKGVLDLAQAFSGLSGGSAYLFFVGPDEQNMQGEITQITESCGRFVYFVGYTNVPEAYMAAADALCLPSYREGFGSVIIEAAAVGIPSVASRIYGITDAIVENETGLLHEPQNINEIKTRMEKIINNAALRLKLGAQARVSIGSRGARPEL